MKNVVASFFFFLTGGHVIYLWAWLTHTHTHTVKKERKRHASRLLSPRVVAVPAETIKVQSEYSFSL